MAETAGPQTSRYHLTPQAVAEQFQVDPAKGLSGEVVKSFLRRSQGASSMPGT